MKENNPFMPEEKHLGTREARDDSWSKEPKQGGENPFCPVHSQTEKNLGATADDSWWK